MEDPAEHTIDNMNEFVLECIDYLKSQLQTEFARDPALNTDWTLLRFLRARKFDKQKTLEMLKKTIKFRAEKNMDRIAQIDKEKIAHIASFFRTFHYTIDRFGRPVIIDMIGASKVNEALQVFEMRDIQDYLIQTYERMIRIEFPICSSVVKRRVDRTFLIFDIAGLGLGKVLQGKFREFLNFSTALGQDHYPEVLGRLFVINAPFIISAVFKIVNSWLDEKTQRKISVVYNVGTKKLAEDIPLERLPLCLGGQNPAPLADAQNPWKAATEESLARKTFYPTDRAPELEYFRSLREKLQLQTRHSHAELAPPSDKEDREFVTPVSSQRMLPRSASLDALKPPPAAVKLSREDRRRLKKANKTLADNNPELSIAKVQSSSRKFFPLHRQTV